MNTKMDFEGVHLKDVWFSIRKVSCTAAKMVVECNQFSVTCLHWFSLAAQYTYFDTLLSYIPLSHLTSKGREGA